MKQPENFQDAMNRLEHIVRRMESGEVPLEEVVSLYEESIQLQKYCRSVLDATEEKVRILQDALPESGGDQ